MLTVSILDRILARTSQLTIGVLGDLFLDRYLDIDPALDELSLETGLVAQQVVRIRPTPGALGTVINNLVALGVARVIVFSFTGDDGEGYELRRALAGLRVVDTASLVTSAEMHTPTYTKPLVHEPGQPPRELQRLDIKNRRRLPAMAEKSLLTALSSRWGELDALIVLDQVSEENCGVVTDAIRSRLADLGQSDPGRLILADSRNRIGLFRNLSAKPNETECRQAVAGRASIGTSLQDSALNLARQIDRPVYCTCGAAGILVADTSSPPGQVTRVPAYPVSGPIDIVGAGDSTSAALACALAAGATQFEAAAFGNLVASITIQQIGTTGTASPGQVRQRWAEIQSEAAG